MSDAAELERIEPTDASDDEAESAPIELDEVVLTEHADSAVEAPPMEPEARPEPVFEAEQAGDPNPLPFILEAVAALDHSFQRRFDALQSTFEREVRAEATREKVVDRLHAELQEYKNDLLLNVLRPVFVDLIQLHDDIGKIVGGGAEADASRLLDLMKGFQQGIEDILYRQGVEPFQNVEDDAFDPRRQRAYATVPNDDPGQAKRVATRLRKGFQIGDKVIRPEIVSVYATPKPGNSG